MKHSLLTLIVTGFFSLGLPFLSLKSAKAITINFGHPDADELSEVNALGLDISGSGNIDLSTGLGIDDFLVDNGESITFTFINSLASSVGTFSAVLTSDGNSSTIGTGTLEGFDVDGFSLGSIAIDPLTAIIDVNGLFGNQLLSSITFTSDLNAGRNFTQISYELVSVETPEPSILLGLGVIGLAGIRGLKRKKN
ncbi:MAG: PEP-CTERM sorting domain-containing protein [Cyanobacteria bacterium SBLK]|nr:PEP-CTERM sorting domain-containing protein [Cyanobacteria bacterium SBLK]